MASKAKKQKLHHYFYQQSWEEEFFVVPIGDGCKCLVCTHVSVSNRKSSVQKHFQSYHTVFDTDFPKGSTVRTQKINALKSWLLKNTSVDAVVNRNSNSTTRLSFKIAYILAKALKPSEDGAIAKEIMIEMANELIEDGEIKNSLLAKVQDTALSNDTIARRVQAISTNIEDRLMKDLQNCAWFSLHLDESTDVSDTAQLSVFVRMVFDDCSAMEELLSVIPLKGRTTVKDVYSALTDALTQKNVPLEKLVSITMDDAPALVERHTELIGLCKEDPDFRASMLNFQQRFQEFIVVQKIGNYFFDPMVQQDTQDIAGIITDLFPTLNVFTIREEMASLRRNEHHRFCFPKCTSVDEFWKMVYQT